MQKPVIFRLSTMIVLLLLASFGMFYVLAAAGPVATGSGLFAIQGLAEQSWLGLQTRPTARFSYTLDLLDRRTRDLTQSIGQGTELNNLVEVDRILNQAMVELANLDSGERQTASARLLDQVNHLLQVTGSLQTAPQQDPQAVANFKAKLTALRNSLLSGQLSAGELIAFSQRRLNAPLSGDPLPRPGFQHPFPLLGKHAEIACLACHRAPAPPDSNACSACHADQERPAIHASYVTDCATCHTPDGWKAANFNHTSPLAAQCAACHESTRPANHAQSECVACHTTPGVTWKGAKFNHALAGVTQCASCHESRRPSNHYSGDCAACHTNPGVAWKGAKLNHALVNITQCASCHESRRPANHYSGDCSNCHTNPGGTWKGAKFGHSGVTQCASCHESRRPANHYKGDCSGCHTQPGVTWAGAKFNHTVAGVTQCASCHENRRPAGHYQGDCAGCHTQPGVTWGGAKFNHSGMTQCASCHESRRPANHSQGECSACHTTPGVTWKGAKFNHAAANITNCSGCHAARRPANHFQAQCSTCHNTSGWKPASFKHTFPMNHNGANSQCATCHPSMTSAYTCFKCHNQAELTKEHAKKKIAFPADCMGCHPNGKE